MFGSLNVIYNQVKRQELVNKLYGELLVASFELKIDLLDLLKELVEIDKALRVEEVKEAKVDAAKV